MTVLAFTVGLALGVAVGIALGPYLLRRSAYRRGFEVGYRRGRRQRMLDFTAAVRDTVTPDAPDTGGEDDGKEGG